MLLTELFDKTLRWDWIDMSFNSSTATFKTPNGQMIKVFFHSYEEPSSEYPNDPSLAELEFNKMMPRERIGTSKITGTGEQFLVFATVLDIAQDYAKRHPTTTIEFGADTTEPSRVKLYTKMVNRLAPNATMELDGGIMMFTIPPKTPRE